jgi:hypothetical protein
VAIHVIEFLSLFFIGPTLFAYARHRIPAIPALWVLTAYCLIILLHDPGFDRERLWNAAALSENALSILGLFAVAAVIGIVLVRRFAPKLFLSFPRSKPRVWSMVMVLYPILSVYPQGIVYRAFLFDRYRDLFGIPGRLCWPARLRSLMSTSCSRTDSRSFSLSLRDCFSRCVICRRVRCSSPHSSTRCTAARSSPLA